MCDSSTLVLVQFSKVHFYYKHTENVYTSENYFPCLFEIPKHVIFFTYAMNISKKVFHENLGNEMFESVSVK